ncbi:helix-turn-helix domain-containing protein [Prochlorococcus sp. AH-716-E17]|nr:helix-turn-helix domain-containing protein [Prochlorococcus sp. AH-716-E17]
MAKRLTEEQKEKILKGFSKGKTIEDLSKEFNCTKLTISRNLKRNLDEKKYKEIIIQNKNEINNKANKSAKNQNPKLKLVSDNNNFLDNKSTSEINDEVDNFPIPPFLELKPLDVEIEKSSRKEFSSVPLSEIDLPKNVFMIVDKKIELVIKFLKDYPEWSFLPSDDLKRKTIEIFFDLREAKRSCQKEQKVIKVPNTNVFRIVSPILLSKGITRIVSSERLISI